MKDIVKCYFRNTPKQVADDLIMIAGNVGCLVIGEYEKIKFLILITTHIIHILIYICMVIIIREEIKKDPDSGIFFMFFDRVMDKDMGMVVDMVEDNK